MQIRNSVLRAVATFAFVVLLISSTACRKTPTVQSAEYDALSAFINGKFGSQKGITRIVISSIPESDQDGINARFPLSTEALQTKATVLQKTTIDSFRSVNTDQALFQRSFHVALDYELADSSQLASLFKNGGWPAFYKRFPGATGILTFSRVGLNSNGTQALFVVSSQCGELCGSGYYVIMETRDDRWITVKEIQAWMS